jgi:hypothetical protein
MDSNIYRASEAKRAPNLLSQSWEIGSFCILSELNTIIFFHFEILSQIVDSGLSIKKLRSKDDW